MYLFYFVKTTVLRWKEIINWYWRKRSENITATQIGSYPLFGFLTFGVLLLQFTPSVDKEIVEMTGEWSQAYYLHLEIESDYLWTIQSCLLIHPATTKLTEIRMNGKKDRWLVFLFVCLFVWQRVRLTYCIFFVLKLHSVRKLSENHTNCELIVKCGRK